MEELCSRLKKLSNPTNLDGEFSVVYESDISAKCKETP